MSNPPVSPLTGLAVRWPLAQAAEGVEERLREYVENASHPRFTGMSDLAFKTWRMRAGEWFEGTYVFADAAARATFQTTFTAAAATSPVSELVGAAPDLIEPFETVAVAEGGSGFSPFAGA